MSARISTALGIVVRKLGVSKMSAQNATKCLKLKPDKAEIPADT
jgi:hypothetical protein